MQRRPAVAVCATMLSAAVYLSAVLRAVPTRHIAFVLSVAAYATAANAFILRSRDTLPTAPLRRLSFMPMKNSARLLFPFTIAFSLLGPAALLAASPPGLRVVVAPHLFLMVVQIMFETVGYLAFSFYTLYVRLGVTIAFVSYRLPVILRWYEMATAWAQTEEARAAQPIVPALAQAAAVLNMVYWAFALLCFLLLYCLPALLREPEVAAEEKDGQKTT